MHSFFQALPIILITRAGLPTATALDGMSCVTTEPAPITTLLPMVTPISTTAFPPIQTLSPMVIGFAIPSLSLRPAASIGCATA